MMYVIVQMVLSLLFSNSLFLENQNRKSTLHVPNIQQTIFLSNDSYRCELDYEIFVTRELFLDHTEREHPYFFEGFLRWPSESREAYLLKQKIKPVP